VFIGLEHIRPTRNILDLLCMCVLDEERDRICLCMHTLSLQGDIFAAGAACGKFCMYLCMFDREKACVCERERE